MIYKSLVTNGSYGGIVSDMEKAMQDENSVTIAIGIGGTGITALRTFKEAVYTRLIPDNGEQENQDPIYNRIRFLAIDSDNSSRSGSGYNIEKSEFFGIGVSNIVDLLNNKSTLDNDSSLQWFDHDNIKVETAKDGACGVREIGRFLIVKKAVALKNRIEQMVNSALVGIKEPSLYIHIFAGISGGTGSGCFIDTCYIVQQALSDIGKLSPANITGFFFLPDVNLSSPGFPNDEAHKSYIQENGYAALKELDYLMNLKDGDGRFKQDYDGFVVDTDMPPVNECYLLSTTDIDGTIPENSFNYVMHALSEYLLNYIAKFDAGKAADQKAVNELTMAGLISNLLTLRGKVNKKHGAEYCYDVMGASSAIIPYREIATYLGTGLFKYFDYYDKLPNEPAVRQFAEITEITYMDLEKALTKEIPALTLPDISAKDLQAGNAPMVSRTNNWLDVASGKLKEAYERLSRDLNPGMWEVSNVPDSIIGKVYKTLLSYVTDSDKGPYYAAAVLKHNDRFAFDNCLEGLLKEVRERVSTEVQQEQLRHDELEKAKSEFLHTGSINPMLNTRKKKYMSEQMNYVRHQHNLEKLRTMEDLLTNVRTKLSRLYQDFFMPLTTVLTNLKETFGENDNLFKAGFHKGAGRQYLWNMVELEGIQDTLDEELKKGLTKDQNGRLSAKQAMTDFMTMMLEPKNIEKWLMAEEIPIVNIVSEFVKMRYKDAIDKSMITYLRNKFNSDGNSLVNSISEDVIGKGLVDNATPAFYADKTAFDVQTQSPIQRVLSIPRDETLLEMAAQTYANKNNIKVTIRKTDVKDRISLMWFYTGIPVFSYQPLRQMETTYCGSRTRGVHLYEKGENNWRKILSSPMPATYVIDNYEASRPDRKRIDRVKADFAFLKENNLIINKGDDSAPEYVIPAAVDIDYDEIKKATERSSEDLADAIAKLEDLKSNFIDTSKDGVDIKIPSGVVSNSMNDAVIDVIVKYPVIYSALFDLRDKYDRLCGEIAALKSNYTGAKVKYIKQFRQAVYAGVIRRNRTKYVYDYKGKGDIDEQKVFTDVGKDFDEVPVYQAALEYALMPDSTMREEIFEKTKAILNGEISDEVFDNANSLLEYFDKDRVKEYRDAARTFNESAEEAENFVIDFYEGLKKFIHDNE